jgi:predicted nucleotidyltransferase
MAIISKQKTIEIVKELNRLLSVKFKDFKGLYLYGSRARDDYREDSDFDIVAIFDNIDREKELDVYEIVTDLDYQYDIFISLFAYTREGLVENPVFYDQVVNKGFFYEAAA